MSTDNQGSIEANPPPKSRLLPLLVSLNLLFLGLFVVRVLGTDTSSSTSLPPCFRVGGPLHHYFEPNCAGHSERRKVAYRINEDGMRERPRAEILPGQTLMLGGSVVEGWELELGHTIGRSLEARSGSSRQFLNGGLRFTGPVLQSALLSKYAQRYSPREVVWVLAENDIDDDRLFFSLGTKRDADETPIEFSTADFDFVAPLVRLRDSIGGIGGLMNAVIGKLYYWNVARLIERSDEKHFRVCAGIDRGLAVARQKKIRVVFLVLSSGPNLPPRKNRENFDQLLACTKGHPLLDLRGELRDQKQLFLESDTHLNELGVDVVTSKILLAHVL